MIPLFLAELRRGEPLSRCSGVVLELRQDCSDDARIQNVIDEAAQIRKAAGALRKPNTKGRP